MHQNHEQTHGLRDRQGAAQQHNHGQSHSHAPHRDDHEHLEVLEIKAADAEVAAQQAHQRELDAQTPRELEAAHVQERRAVQVAAGALERARAVAGHLNMSSPPRPPSSPGEDQDPEHYVREASELEVLLGKMQTSMLAEESFASEAQRAEAANLETKQVIADTVEMLQASQRRVEIEEAKVVALENVAASLREEADIALEEVNSMAAAATEARDQFDAMGIAEHKLRAEVEALQEDLRMSRQAENIAIEDLREELRLSRAEEAETLAKLVEVREENALLATHQAQIEGIVQSLHEENMLLQKQADAAKQAATREAELAREARQRDADMARADAFQLREELDQAWVDIGNAQANNAALRAEIVRLKANEDALPAAERRVCNLEDRMQQLQEERKHATEECHTATALEGILREEVDVNVAACRDESAIVKLLREELSSAHGALAAAREEAAAACSEASRASLAEQSATNHAILLSNELWQSTTNERSETASCDAMREDLRQANAGALLSRSEVACNLILREEIKHVEDTIACTKVETAEARDAADREEAKYAEALAALYEEQAETAVALAESRDASACTTKVAEQLESTKQEAKSAVASAAALRKELAAEVTRRTDVEKDARAIRDKLESLCAKEATGAEIVRADNAGLRIRLGLEEEAAARYKGAEQAYVGPDEWKMSRLERRLAAAEADAAAALEAKDRHLRTDRIRLDAEVSTAASAEARIMDLQQKLNNVESSAAVEAERLRKIFALDKPEPWSARYQTRGQRR